MISLLLMGQIGQLFLMILMGYILVKSGLLKSTDSKTISIIVLYLVIPCTIINSFQVDYTVETRNGLILAVIAAIFIHIIFFALTKLLGKIFKFNSIEKASIIYSNAGNLIIPIVAGILGDKWVLYCCGFMSVQLVFLWTHCKMMISEEKGADLRKIIINVNTIAILIGLILFITGIKLPGITKDTVAAVSKLIAPLSMIVAGMLMAGVKLRTIFTTKRIYLVALMRMIIYPAVVLVFLKLTNLTSYVPDGYTILLISFLATMTPSASTVTQMAQVYDNDADYANMINVFTVLVCIATMPLMVMAYEIILK